MKLYRLDDKQAFDQLYFRHRERTYSYLLARLRSDTAADEVFQNSFLKLHRFRRHYRPSQPFLPWFFTLVRNELVSYFRKVAQRKEVYVEVPEFASPQSPVAAELLWKDIEDLRELKDIEKQAIFLRYHEQHEFEEIGERLHMKAANVRQVLSRGLRKARKALGEKQ